MLEKKTNQIQDLKRSPASRNGNYFSAIDEGFFFNFTFDWSQNNKNSGNNT